MIRKILLVASMLALSACAVEHGGPDDPIASADFPFQSSLAGEIAIGSQSFAKDNDLTFRQNKVEEGLSLSLTNSQLTIEVTGSTKTRRLKVAAKGPATPAHIEVAGRYIRLIDSIR